MPNLDLSIVKIMHGDVPVLKIMEGDTKIWPSGTDVIVDGILTNTASSVSLPATVALNGSFTTTLTANTSCILNQVEVIMGGVDITSTAYSNGVITIADVTGDVMITALAVEVITFADAAVKQICVTNWGGGVIPGEITPAEAAAVTSLSYDKNGESIGGPFYGNTSITSFDEFIYFTGIEGNGMYYRMTDTSSTITYRGHFAGCTNLVSIKVPAIETLHLAGIFYNCKKLVEVDLSGLTLTGTTSSNQRCNVAFQYCSNLKKLIFPSQNYTPTGVARVFGTSSSNAPTKLEYIDFGGFKFTDVPTTSGTPAHMLNYCTSLKDLPVGIPNLAHTQSLAACPLTHESAVNVINSLKSVSTTQTLTFKATTYQTLTAEEIAVGTAKGWSIVST